MAFNIQLQDRSLRGSPGECRRRSAQTKVLVQYPVVIRSNGSERTDAIQEEAWNNSS